MEELTKKETKKSKGEYSHCGEIYTPGFIDYLEKKKKHKNKYFKKKNKFQKYNPQHTSFKKQYKFRRTTNYPKRYHLKRHVKRYNKNKTRKDCRCYICDSKDHLANKCPKTNQNWQTREYSKIIEDTEQVFIDISDNTNVESVYSIYLSEDQKISLNSSANKSSSEDDTINLLNDITQFTI